MNFSLRRLNAGWSPEQAVGIEPSPIKLVGKAFSVEGKEFQTRKMAAAYYGINYGTFLSRLNVGWSPKQAVELAAKPKLKQRIKG